MSQTLAPSHRIAPERDLDRLDVQELKQFLARRYAFILATALGCVIIAALVCVSVTPVYTGTSQVLLDPRKQHVFGQEAVAVDSALDSSIVDSQIPIILSTRLLARVVEKENLADDPEFAGSAKQGMLDEVFGLFRGARNASVESPSLDGIDPKLAPVVLRLFNRIDVTRVAKSYVLSLSVSSRDPAKAARLANSLAQTYVEDQISVHGKSVQQAAAFFEDRLGNLRDQVRESEKAVADFRKAHNLTTTIMDGPTTVGEQQLQDLNVTLATASSDTAERLAKYEQASRFTAAGTNLDSLPEIIRSPVITQLRTQQADLTRREADLSAMYGPAYPAITQIHAQRSGLDRAITAEMKRLVSTLRNDYEVAKAREASLRKTIAGLSDTSGGDNDVGVKLRELERTNLANKALFENFLNRAKLTQEQSSFEEPDARLISPALEPATPTSPKTKLILPIAGVAGLLLGLGLAALLDRSRGQVDDAVPRDLPATRGAFILGRVPDLASEAAGDVDCATFLEEHPRSDFARSIEALVATLAPVVAASTSPAAGRVIAFASLSAREGATSLALCAATSAGRRRRVLLVDTDWTRRGLSRLFDLDKHPGLSDVVAGDLPANKAVVRRERFAWLPAGRKPFASADASARLRAFLDEARERFDLVILDLPAIDAGAEARVIGAMADGIALVASWDQLLRDDFIAAVDAIADEPNFAGVILNRVEGHDNRDMALAS